MKLLTPEILSHLPRLHATEKDDDPIAYARLEASWLGWVWYILEFDGRDVCYGYIRGMQRECAYFNLAEIESLRGPRWQRAKRDPNFEPTAVSALRARLK